MKKILLLLVATMLMLSACDPFKKEKEEIVVNTKETIRWIDNHDMPITCMRSNSYSHWGSRYTLIDVKGTIYDTKAISLTLPDTIKVNED